MKKRIKKTIALLILMVSVLGTSITALAASCLDVRDYGYHRYAQRTYYIDSNEVMGMNNGVVHYVVTREIWGECVCGERALLDTIQFDEYVPAP